MPEVRISAWLCSSWSQCQGLYGGYGADFSDKRRMRPARYASASRGSSNAFILRFAGAEGFFVGRSSTSGPIRLRAGLSNITRFALPAEHLKDQPMLKTRLFVIGLACLASISHAITTTISEDFSSNPLQQGWRIFGDTNLFQWDGTNQNLRVTWDSSQSNSYFYHPLGTILTRQDDFSLGLDLKLTDIGPGPDTNKATSFPIAIGFLNLDLAAATNFVRGTGTNSPDLAEIAYFWDSGFGATLWPTFVDTNSTFNYNSSSDFAIFALAPGDFYHVFMNYMASNQTAVLTITNFEKTSGVRITQLINTNFGDYRLRSISISSYSDAGQDPQYAGSVVAHGVVDNLLVTVPAPPVENVVGFLSNSVWNVQFTGQPHWLYTLEQTIDFQTWSNASSSIEGVETTIVLRATNSPIKGGFYRVRAERP